MHEFLPVTGNEKTGDGEQVDFVYLTGDAYVDHSSFGSAIIQQAAEKPRLPGWHHSSA